jgi:hypothetical protein
MISDDHMAHYSANPATDGLLSLPQVHLLPGQASPCPRLIVELDAPRGGAP